MQKLYIIFFFYLFLFVSEVNSKENFLNEAINKYENKKFEESKFLFQRNIVYNPKNAESYLYLAKIFNSEKNEKEEIKNLKTTLLLQPDNEEAMYMLIEIKLEKSDFIEVNEFKKKFEIICSSMCNKIASINEKLKNIDINNESKQ